MAYDPWQAATRGSQVAQNIANAYQQAKQRKILNPYLQPEAKAGLDLKRAQAQLTQAKAQDPLLGSGGSFTGGPGLTIQRAKIRSLMTGQPFQITKEDLTAGENRAAAQTASLQQRGTWSYLPDATKLQMIKAAQQQAAQGDRSALDAVLPQMSSIEKQHFGLATDTGQELHAGQAATTGQPLQPPTAIGPAPEAQATPSVISPEEREEFKKMAGQTTGALEIKTSDQSVRKRVAMSGSLLSEMKKIDISPVQYYSGTQGVIDLKQDTAANFFGTLKGEKLKRYNSYNVFANQVHKLATDTVRNTLETSQRERYVSEYIAKTIFNKSQGIDNALHNNPSLALKLYNDFNKYIQDYHDGFYAEMTGGVAAKEALEKKRGYKQNLIISNVPNSTQENIDFTAKQMGISTDEVIQILKQKHGVK